MLHLELNIGDRNDWITEKSNENRFTSPIHTQCTMSTMSIYAYLETNGILYVTISSKIEIDMWQNNRHMEFPYNSLYPQSNFIHQQLFGSMPNDMIKYKS